ncbi:hypothetical protein B0H14DRAFT_3130187 [Mycena olivaceomarginata]|nr:hypothetical protein B0H14DRAFT_3130187 [Mycena olivaceomarginata]
MFSVKSETSHASNFGQRPTYRSLRRKSIGDYDHQSPQSLAYTVAYFVLCTGSANIFIVFPVPFDPPADFGSTSSSVAFRFHVQSSDKSGLREIPDSGQWQCSSPLEFPAFFSGTISFVFVRIPRYRPLVGRHLLSLAVTRQLRTSINISDAWASFREVAPVISILLAAVGEQAGIGLSQFEV